MALGGAGCAARCLLGRARVAVGHASRPTRRAARGDHRVHRDRDEACAGATHLGRTTLLGPPIAGLVQLFRPPRLVRRQSTRVRDASARDAIEAQRGRTPPHPAQLSRHAGPASGCTVGSFFLSSSRALLASAGSSIQHAATRWETHRGWAGHQKRVGTWLPWTRVSLPSTQVRAIVHKWHQPWSALAQRMRLQGTAPCLFVHCEEEHRLWLLSAKRN